MAEAYVLGMPQQYCLPDFKFYIGGQGSMSKIVTKFIPEGNGIVEKGRGVACK